MISAALLAFSLGVSPARAAQPEWVPLKSFLGHSDEVFSLVLDEPNKRVYSSGRDGEIRIWSYDGGEIGRVSAGPGAVKRIAFDRAGKRLVAASWNGTARVWDVIGRPPYLKPARVLREEFGQVWFAGFTPDGRWIVSAGQSSTLRSWSAADGAQSASWEIREEQNGTRAFAMSPTENLAAVGSSTELLQLWKVPEGTLAADLKGHKKWVWSLAFTRDGRTLASGSDDWKIRLWDVAGRKLTRTLSGHTNTVYALAFSGDGKALVSAGIDETFRTWDAREGTLLDTRKVHDIVNAIALTADGKRLFVGEMDGTIEIWIRKERQ